MRKNMAWVLGPDNIWHWRIIVRQDARVRWTFKGDKATSRIEPERFIVSRIRGCTVLTKTRKDHPILYTPDEPPRNNPLCPDCCAVYAEYRLKYG